MGEYVVIVGVVKNNPVIVYNRDETITFRIEEIGTPGAILMLDNAAAFCNLI